MGYAEDIRIDGNALDIEWLNQPSLYFKYSEELAYARDKLDRSKELLDVTRAELAGDIRSNPSIYGVEKVTADSVNDAIARTLRPGYETTGSATTDQFATAYREADAAYLKQKLEVELLTIAARAIGDQRKAALENMVALWKGQYYAGPKEPRDMESSFKEAAKKSVGDGLDKKIADRAVSRKK